MKNPDQFYMDIARRTAENSYAVRLKVGAVAVLRDDIISFAYNGTLPGEDNVCEEMIDGQQRTKDSVLHAEENLLVKCARDGKSVSGSTLYVTHAPCIKCARMIAAAGFSRLVYGVEYRDASGLDLLEQRYIEVQKI